jgi:DNA repair exonuclease SbcCD ATPase subunit
MIDLKKLHLDGWLSYDKASFTLNSKGVTLIKGNIGSGKSAIFEAIFYLLFGKTIRDKDSVNSLVNKILDGGYDISLELKINGTPYKIQEIRNRTKKGLYFYKADTPIVGISDTETRKLILAELGISASEFKSIAFFGQKQSQIMLTGTPGERASALVDIFGLDKYDIAIKSCMDRIKAENGNSQEYASDIEHTEKEIENLEDLIEDADSIDEAVAAAKSKRLEKADESIATIEEKLSKISNVADKYRQVVNKAAAFKKQADQARILSQEVAELRVKLINTEWPDFTSEELTGQMQGLRDEKNNYTVILEQSQREIKTVNEYENICPVNQKACPTNVPRSFKDKTLEACAQTITKASKEIIVIDRKLTETKDDLQLAQKREQTIESTRAKAALLRQISPQQEFNVTEAKEQIEKCELALEKGNIKLREHKDLQNSLKVDLAVYEKTQAMRKTVLGSIARNTAKLAESKKKLEEVSITIKYLAASLSIIKKVKMYKIDTVLQLLNKYVTEILDQISYGVYKAQFVSQQSDATGSRLLDKIGILVSDPYKTIPVELCSGGQSTEVGLAVLLGTWKAAHALSAKSVSSLWLDEVFGSLDQDAIDRVFEAVIDVAADLGANSVKIISHRELDPRLFHHTWNIDMEDGISTTRIA